MWLPLQRVARIYPWYVRSGWWAEGRSSAGEFLPSEETVAQ